MKILFVLELYKPHIGGVEVLFENMIFRLAENHQIKILTTRFDKSLPKYEKVSENIQIYRVGHNRYDFMMFALFKGINLGKWADLIHTTTYNAAIPANIIAKITNKKCVIHVHEIFGKLWYKFMGWKGFFFKMFEDMIFLFNFDRYICISNYTKNSLRISYNIDDDKLIKIYNGVDYELWDVNNYSQEDMQAIRDKYEFDKYFVGLFFGRPGISKGLEVYIRAVQYMSTEFRNFRAFLIVSPNDKKRVKYIKDLILKLGIEENIIWIDSVPRRELGNYLLAADFVVIPSLAEGFGFAAVEACSIGANVLVSDIASLPEVVSGNVKFFSAGNHKDLFKKIMEVREGNIDVLPAKTFLWEDNIDRVLELYRDMLGK